MAFFKVREAAKKLKIPEYLLRRMIKSGECPGIYSGSWFYVDIDALSEKLSAASEQNARF